MGHRYPFVLWTRLLPDRLRKPPFRFLFDAVAEVARQTGIDAAELFGGPPGEKAAAPGAFEEKVAFVEGWIALAAGALGELAAHLARVSPQDIVCGVRPEWANYLLQCTASAAWPGSLGAPPSPSQLDPSLAPRSR
ncbi:unnamed protein product [Prorocentrum cordatum]|uniref:TRAF3-interacting protein 1 N-terminal domain-containing protein n=1 Tax=Prorocentrum cordatum TaxID=2364126 RepID=A0ABN9VNJ9_9DINO|nr:unnamed protein product [Polarella glacialis]